MTTTPDWRTDAEKSDYRRTPRFDDSMAWWQRLAAATDTIELSTFGTSPEGRALPLVIASADRCFTPEAARAAGKIVLLVQAGIHSGEIEGKDAGMALVRDLTLAGVHPGLLRNVVLLHIPVFNVDGHEMATPYNRINQNGPEEMGWRANAQRINLNRDFMKADAPEMRAWLALWTRWTPDAFVDVHSTNGADYVYDLTWYLEEWENQHAAIRAWQQRTLIERVFPATEAMAHRLAPYLELEDHNDIRKGVANFGSGPRFSTGQVALRHRPGVLLETHMLKDYGSRVRVTYDFLLALIRELEADPQALRDAVAEADRETLARTANPEATAALNFATTNTPETLTLDTYAFSHTRSEISNDVWTQYDPTQPRTFDVPFRRALEVTQRVTLPAAYAVPAGWPDAISRIAAHGLQHRVLNRAITVHAIGTRVHEPRWATAPFEGRLMLESFRSETFAREVTIAAHSVIVPLMQVAADVAVHLLEPDASDSLLRWGFFNLAFEQREMADARVAEQLARDMLREDPALRAEFEEALKDPAFAQSPDARLNFFFLRSRWGDPMLNVHPVWRLDADALAEAIAASDPAAP